MINVLPSSPGLIKELVCKSQRNSWHTGFTVLVGSRNFEKGEAAAQSIGSAAHAVQLDVTDQASVTAAAERIRNEFGRLDLLGQQRGDFEYRTEARM